MESHSRYFANNLGDFAGKVTKVPEEKIVERIEELLSVIIKGASADYLEGGLYVGSGGIAYALWYISTKIPSKKDKLLVYAKKLIDAHLNAEKKHAKAEDEVGFLLGLGGLYFVAALIAKSLENRGDFEHYVKRYTTALKIGLKKDFLRKGSDELFVGRAGYLCGILNMRLKLGHNFNSEDITKLIGVMLESGESFARDVKSPCPLMYAYHGTQYLGAAHGLSSILQMLISFPDNLKAAGGEALAKASVDFLVKIQQENGNFSSSLDELGSPKKRHESKELFHWCHGSPGVIYLMARAYQLWKEPKYLDACLRCGEGIWERGLLKKGPGVCHGVAGNAEAFLCLYRLTGDEKYLHRAHQFAAFLQAPEFLQGARTPDRPLSLYEGLAGTACFYADLLQPKNSEFPLFPVFF